MSVALPEWGSQSRFYVPNEDAGVVRAALESLSFRPRTPVFVGGSGMVLLEAIRILPDLEAAFFVDVAAFQCMYVERLFTALETLPDSASFRTWFKKNVYPELRAHFLARKAEYPWKRVLNALENKFGIAFMFNDAAYGAARKSVARVQVVEKDILNYLAVPQSQYDFIYLSNVPDYLPLEEVETLFEICRQYRAPVYMLLTSACKDVSFVTSAWTKAGYRAHPAGCELDAINRGLGCANLDTSWNRPGVVFLLESTP